MGSNTSIRSQRVNNDVASSIEPQGTDELSLGIILFFNVLALIVLWFVLLVPLNEGLVTLWGKFFSCPPSTIETLGVALILLEVAHLIWRSFGRQLVQLMQQAHVPVISAVGQLLLGVVRLLNPQALDNRALWAQFGVALVVASALVWLSPPIGRVPGVPILLSGFTVQRSTEPSTTIEPGDALLVAPGEKIYISADVSGPTAFECTWFTNIGTNLGTDGCSLTYSAPRSANLDNISILVSSLCGANQASAGFHIEVAQTTP